MRVWLIALGLTLALAAPAQQLTVDQVVEFVRSSIKLGHKDSQVAKLLKSVRMTEKLDASTIEDLQGLGAGPKTLEALNELRAASAELSKAAPVIEPERPEMPPPSTEEQQRVIGEVRDYALNYTDRLPDFICTQVTRRYADPSGLEFWQKLDTVTAKVSYFDQKEDYRVILVNNRPVDMGVDDLGGSTSTGEFGTMMREIFEPATDAKFRWERWGKLRGRLAHVYSYFVPKRTSKWVISYEKTMSTVPAYRGLIYVDKDTLQVARITLDAVDIEPSFPVQQASTTLDYGYTEISGNRYLLPLKFDMRMRQGKLLIKNEVEFRLYRKFGVETVISFDTPEELPEEQLIEQPVQPEP